MFDITRKPYGKALELERFLKDVAEHFARFEADDGIMADIDVPLEFGIADTAVQAALLGAEREQRTAGEVEYRLMGPGPWGGDEDECMALVTLRKLPGAWTHLTVSYIGMGDDLARGHVRVRRERFMEVLETLALLLPRGDFWEKRPKPKGERRDMRYSTWLKLKRVQERIERGETMTAACRAEGVDIRTYKAYVEEIEAE